MTRTLPVNALWLSGCYQADPVIYTHNVQAVMDSIVAELAQLTKALAAELEADLCKLINKHPYIQVPKTLKTLQCGGAHTTPWVMACCTQPVPPHSIC